MTNVTMSLLDDKSSSDYSKLAHGEHLSSLFQLLSARTAIKNFASGVTIPEADIRMILQMASLSPSAFNIQPWYVTSVTCPKVRETLCDLAWRQSQILDASVVLAVAMDLKSWTRRQIRGCHTEKEEDKNRYREFLKNVYENNYQFARDEAIRSVSLFSMSLMLASESLGYQSCPMSGFDYPKVNKLLGFEGGMEACMLIAIGVAEKSTKAVKKNRVPVSEFYSVL